MASSKGIVVLVVGPSGAGKDSVMRGAAEILADNQRFVFPRRVVTRQADIDTEDHDSMSDFEFASAIRRGEFTLSWQAHGNQYGIPKQVSEEIASGRVVIINVSRHVLHVAAERFPSIVIAEITAAPEVCSARIQDRGREQTNDTTSRTLRQTPPFPLGIEIIRIENNGALEDAIAKFTDALIRL